MRHWRFVTLVTAIAVLVSASPALANGSGAATFTEHQFNVTDTFLDANFCTGDPAMITTIRTGVFHVTELPNFTYHITGTATGTFELVPLDPALPTYIGRFTQHFSESGNGLSKEAQGMPIKVELVEELGSDAYVYGHVALEGQDERFVVRTDPRKAPELGSTVYVKPRTDHHHAFHSVTGLRL